MSDDSRPYWETKRLHEMSEAEWESLCDGCGRCCLNKLEDWDTGEIHFTNVACTLFDGKSCRCKDYSNRFATVPDCVRLKPEDVGSYKWLPPTCAYRLLDEGSQLPQWHPLISGSYQSVIDAGASVSGRSIPEDGMSPEGFEDHIVSWPGEDPTA